MSNKYNSIISKMTASVNAIAKEISNDSELLEGEKFLLLQRIFADLKPLQKQYEKSEAKLKKIAKENLKDLGNGQSEKLDYLGAELMVKYSYPKPTLDAEKLKVSLEQAFAEIGTNFNESEYLKESSPRQTVIIQSVLNK